MELKEFIKEVLADITDAVAESQQELKNGCIIAPIINNSNNTDNLVKLNKGGYAIVSNVHFDVAVTLNEDTDRKTKIGVLSSALSLGTEKKRGVISSEVSKITLDIPILLPYKSNLNPPQDLEIYRPTGSRSTLT